MKRPDFINIKTGSDFNQWYWLKEEMVTICKQINLPANGSKFQLRDRILFALNNNGKREAVEKTKKPVNTFNWAKTKLTAQTVITDNVSFGPNLRGFLQSHIGNKFVCHSDFMNWVKNNTGKTLQDAIIIWEELENRKTDPDFKRTIADHNMLARYVRDFLNDNPGNKFKDALRAWKIKKELPTVNGFIKYNASDRRLIGK